jgi:hypothetical protein
VAVIDGTDGRTSQVSNVLKVALGDLPPGSNTGGAAAAATTPRGGDFDGDGQVDGADFLAWQRGAADAAELSAWQGNFASSAISGEAAALDAAFAGDSSGDFLESLRLANANLDLTGQQGVEVNSLLRGDFDIEATPEDNGVASSGADVETAMELETSSGHLSDDIVAALMIDESENALVDSWDEFDQAFESMLGAPLSG